MWKKKIRLSEPGVPKRTSTAGLVWTIFQTVKQLLSIAVLLTFAIQTLVSCDYGKVTTSDDPSIRIHAYTRMLQLT